MSDNRIGTAPTARDWDFALAPKAGTPEGEAQSYDGGLPDGIEQFDKPRGMT